MFVGRLKYIEAKHALAVKERDESRADLERADEHWFAHLRSELEKATAQHIAATEETEARWDAERGKLRDDIAALECDRAAMKERSVDLEHRIDNLQLELDKERSEREKMQVELDTARQQSQRDRFNAGKIK